MYNDNIPTYQREEIINTRISNRNIPSQELEPLLSFYPKSTKYIQQPILDSRNTPIKKYNYSTQIFNPGYRSPWQGYANAINIETGLKNLFPLSRSNENIYVPSSTSDLYNYPTLTTNYTLFDEPPKKVQTTPESIFHNHTRSWLNA